MSSWHFLALLAVLFVAVVLKISFSKQACAVLEVLRVCSPANIITVTGLYMKLSQKHWNVFFKSGIYQRFRKCR